MLVPPVPAQEERRERARAHPRDGRPDSDRKNEGARGPEGRAFFFR